MHNELGSGVERRGGWEIKKIKNKLENDSQDKQRRRRSSSYF